MWGAAGSSMLRIRATDFTGGTRRIGGVATAAVRTAVARKHQ
jgi:hypothetical protein